MTLLKKDQIININLLKTNLTKHKSKNTFFLAFWMKRNNSFKKIVGEVLKAKIYP